MDNLFSVRVLTAAINLMTPAPSLILDTVFGFKDRQLSDRFAWDIESNSEEVMDNIGVSAPAQVVAKEGHKIVTCQAPRYAEKRFISAADLNGMRAYGQEQAVELTTARIAREQTKMKRKADMTREFQAARAIRGQVVDRKGTVLVDYNFGASQKPVLAGAALWTDANSNPMNDLRAWKKQISQACGNVTKFVAFCGTAVMDALLNNPNITEQLKYTKGDQVAEQGTIAHLAGVEIHEYFGSYIDQNGQRQDLIPVDHFVMVGITGDSAAELFAPVLNLEAPNGVGNHKAADIFFSDSWLEKDPSGRWIRIEARPLPVLMRPECVIDAQPV